MTDKLIEQIKAYKADGDILARSVIVETKYLESLEARILADAKVIEAAKELATSFEACIKEMMDGYHDNFDGVWWESDFEKKERPYREALAAFNEALKGEE